jgi:hypothetical protein
MIPSTVPRRRVLLRALASALVASTSRLSFGRAGNDDARDKLVAGAPEPSKADGEGDKVTDGQIGSKAAAKKGKNAVLTVVVSGNDKPIAQAEVKVRFPPSVGGEATLPTNQTGEATFNSAATGPAKVRVVVTGWASVLKEVTLKEGPQRLTIKLISLPDAAK